MWQFFAGVLVGAVFGVFVMCLMTVAGNADREAERFFDSRDDGD